MPPVASPNASAIRPGPHGGWSPVELGILDLTNKARAEAHLSTLQSEDVLREAAVSHSSDMLDRNFFGHVNRSGGGPEDRILRIHRTLVGITGENIWDGSGDYYVSNPELASLIVDGWMHSPGHRANILRKEYTHLGVGVVIRDLEVRATQDFARVRAYLNVPLPERVVAGTAIDLSTHGPPPPPEMFDLQHLPEGADGRAQNPMPTRDARLNAAPGHYRLRLYFPSGNNEFEIFSGPSLLIER